MRCAVGSARLPTRVEYLFCVCWWWCCVWKLFILRPLNIFHHYTTAASHQSENRFVNSCSGTRRPVRRGAAVQKRIMTSINVILIVRLRRWCDGWVGFMYTFMRRRYRLLLRIVLDHKLMSVLFLFETIDCLYDGNKRNKLVYIRTNYVKGFLVWFLGENWSVCWHFAVIGTGRLEVNIPKCYLAFVGQLELKTYKFH